MVPLEEQFLLICEKESNDLKSQESTQDSIDGNFNFEIDALKIL